MIGEPPDDLAFLIDNHCVLQRADQTRPECRSVFVPQLLTLGLFFLCQTDGLGLVRKLVDAVDQFSFHCFLILSAYCPYYSIRLRKMQ